MIVLMEEMLGLYAEVGVRLEQQQAALSRGDLKEVDTQSDGIDCLNRLLAGVEKKRLRLSQGLAQRLGRSESELSVSALVKLLPLNQQGRLRHIATSLKQELRRVTASRQLLESLLGHHSRFTNRRLGHLQVLGQRRNTYGADAKAKQDSHSKLLDRTV